MGLRGLVLEGLNGVSKKSGLSIQILKVESEWPVTINPFSIIQELKTWWLECLDVSKAPIVFNLG